MMARSIDDARRQASGLPGRTHLENTAEDSAFVIPNLSRNLWNLTDKKFEIPRKLGMTGSCKCNHPITCPKV
jgi:hypothetical protein